MVATNRAEVLHILYLRLCLQRSAFTVHSYLTSTVNTIFLPLLYIIATLKNGVYDGLRNLSSWKHCVTTTNNSLHESRMISQAKYSAKQHHIQNYFYADILTTCTTPKFSLAFVNTAP